MSEPAAAPPRSRDRAPTLRLLGLGGLAVGAVLALVAGSRAWWRAAGTGVSVSFTGTEATAGLAQALALVVLAGALLGLVLRSRGRRVLGVLLVLAGAGVVVVGALRPRPASGAVESRVLEVSLADQFALVGTAWPYVYALGGLLVLAAALVMSVTAPRWPSRASRFERSNAVPTVAVATDGPLREDDPASLWKLLDAGVDPTDPEQPDARVGAEPGEDQDDVADPAVDRDAPHTAQPLGGRDPNHPGTTERPTTDPDPVPSQDGARPSGRVGVHEHQTGVTMNPRATARTDEPT